MVLYLLTNPVAFYFFFLINCPSPANHNFQPESIPINQTTKQLFDSLKLEKLGLSAMIFERAVTGWNIMKEKHLSKSNLLSIIDLSQSCNSKRLYIIDFKTKKLAFHTYVAHGRNSGQEFATSFSNQINSYKSSLGFYLTEGTYQSSHGLSLRLTGVEKGINDIATLRGIVIHGASYVSESFIQTYGRLGRSLGCPAVTQELCEPIIQLIKGGSCLFIFYPDSNYLKQSHFL